MPKAKDSLRAEIVTLQRQKRELEAQLAHVYHFAKHGIAKADCCKTAGSGIVVQLHWLGGKEVCPPFMIKDGFSFQTIEGLMSDLKRSFDIATEFKP